MLESLKESKSLVLQVSFTYDAYRDQSEQDNPPFGILIVSIITDWKSFTVQWNTVKNRIKLFSSSEKKQPTNQTKTLQKIFLKFSWYFTLERDELLIFFSGNNLAKNKSACNNPWKYWLYKWVIFHLLSQMILDDILFI